MDVTQTPAAINRKEAQQQVENSLLSLADLRSALGKKKFKRRLKKAGRLLTQGIPKSIQKKRKSKNVAVEAAA